MISLLFGWFAFECLIYKHIFFGSVLVQFFHGLVITVRPLRLSCSWDNIQIGKVLNSNQVSADKIDTQLKQQQTLLDREILAGYHFSYIG